MSHSSESGSSKTERGTRRGHHAPVPAAKIATVVIMTIMFSVFLLDIVTVLCFNHYEKRYVVGAEDFAFAGQGQGNRIHFLNTENSDAILLESDGHFALIDSGWGSDHPVAAARRPGCEARVLAYLKKVAAGPDGVARLDFVLCTHYHYDHAGGFARILSDPGVEVALAYFRPTEQRGTFKRGSAGWQMQELRQRLVAAAQARAFPISEALPAETFSLGSMRLQFLNIDSYENPKAKGENDNSICTLVSVNGARALLTADITNIHGLEKQIGRQVGRVDLLKLPHHGYALSNSVDLLRALQPKLAIVTNGLGQVYPNVKWNLTMVARAPYYSTARENGVIAHFEADGSIRLTGGLHEANPPSAK